MRTAVERKGPEKVRTVEISMHVLPWKTASILLMGRLTEGLEKDCSLGLRERGSLAWLLDSHYDSEKVFL